MKSHIGLHKISCCTRIQVITNLFLSLSSFLLSLPLPPPSAIELRRPKKKKKSLPHLRPLSHSKLPLSSSPISLGHPSLSLCSHSANYSHHRKTVIVKGLNGAISACI
ncbi:hypothetical protein CIPAW_11G122400 [Carya illinoinensis]|uniref:Uncharacterized protein n=1 Tax=Carya illinoinensis TaxID=32201 RepID=A0A8T1P5B4_CARIL|nr:hypothetical protein CIPAW_11G122400 [Carya illinoinensis]